MALTTTQSRNFPDDVHGSKLTSNSEKEAGKGIKRAIDGGLVKREDIFVTTKLWNNYHRKEHALQMAKAQNDAWGLGYIDLYLIHFPVALKYVDPKEITYPVRKTSPRREGESN